jgi:hypothetical protein
MNLFSKLGHAIASFFKGHQSAIQTAISEAQTAAGAATAVATVLGEPPSVAQEIGRISDGLTLASSAIAAESGAQTLSQHAANLSALTTNLVTSGDIGIRNTATQAAVGTMAQKVQGVVGALETAAAAVPPAVVQPVTQN